MSTPPGMKCGYDFNVVDTQQFPVLPAKKNVINLTNILQVEDSLGLTIQEKKKDVKKEEIKETKPEPVAKVVNIDTEEQEEVIPVESSIPVLKISETPSLKVLEKADWAEELAVKPVLDFKERVPKMAYKWDFELDPFQQLVEKTFTGKCKKFRGNWRKRFCRRKVESWTRAGPGRQPLY
ncbi:uncharacterized protein LOC142330284 isoform X2 [Lycorma delicatula]|uniref:uncharacterized protein LOC142330284 isoform X2 n=1 Tax=Lycorma delicatula TaxID=130591 RepID=UPI003F5111D4